MLNEAVHVVAGDAEVAALRHMESLPASDQDEAVVILHQAAGPLATLLIITQLTDKVTSNFPNFKRNVNDQEELFAARRIKTG